MNYTSSENIIQREDEFRGKEEGFVAGSDDAAGVLAAERDALAIVPPDVRIPGLDEITIMDLYPYICRDYH